MKKIFYIANVTLPTGWAHGYQIMKTCEALADYGCEMKLLITDRMDPFFTQDAFATYRVKPLFPVHRLPVLGIGYFLPFWTERVTFILERWTFLNSLRKFLPSLKQADAIYVRDSYLADKLREMTNIPIIYEMHSLPSEKTLKQLQHSSGVACLTSELAKIVNAECVGVPTTVVPDAADVTVFDPAYSKEEARKMLGMAPQDLVVAYGGQFTTMGKGKGVGELDGVVAELQAKFPSVKLYLIGGTEADFERVEGRKPSTSTNCVGFIPRDVLATYLRAADVVAMPFPNTPHYAKAMSPMKMFEYMASGTVMLTSDLPSVRDVLSEETASFYTSDDLADLKAKLGDLLSDSEMRTRKGAAAKELVKTSYTWRARAERIVNFVDQIVAKK